jgi:hypothetical protein
MADVPSLFFRTDCAMPMSSAGDDDQRLTADGFEQNQRLGPDLSLRKQVAPYEGKVARGIPCYFSKNSLLAGNLAAAFGRGGF